jgi:hypothetical protein
VNPPKSVMMRGMAVLSIVWSNEAKNMATMSPAIVSIISRRGKELMLAVFDKLPVASMLLQYWYQIRIGYLKNILGII